MRQKLPSGYECVTCDLCGRDDTEVALIARDPAQPPVTGEEGREVVRVMEMIVDKLHK